MRCIWCGKQNADGIAVISKEPCYCKDCQLKLLKKYGWGDTAIKLMQELVAKGAVVKD